jgi:hypothetical protein
LINRPVSTASSSVSTDIVINIHPISLTMCGALLTRAVPQSRIRPQQFEIHRFPLLIPRFTEKENSDPFAAVGLAMISTVKS